MNVFDLSLPISGVEAKARIEPDPKRLEQGITMSWLHLHSHSGTHMDAPLHFLPEASTLDKMPLQKCVGPALVCDLSHKTPDSFITVEDLAPYAAKIGHRSRVLLRTDWDLHYGTERYSTHFPRIRVDCAEWLAQRGIWLIGVEHPSVAKLGDVQELTEVHHAFLREEIVIVESLANLRQPPENVMFCALPLKIVGGDGTPTRAIAWVE